MPTDVIVKSKIIFLPTEKTVKKGKKDKKGKKSVSTWSGAFGVFSFYVIKCFIVDVFSTSL